MTLTINKKFKFKYLTKNIVDNINKQFNKFENEYGELDLETYYNNEFIYRVDTYVDGYNIVCFIDSDKYDSELLIIHIDKLIDHRYLKYVKNDIQSYVFYKLVNKELNQLNKKDDAIDKVMDIIAYIASI